MTAVGAVISLRLDDSSEESGRKGGYKGKTEYLSFLELDDSNAYKSSYLRRGSIVIDNQDMHNDKNDQMNAKMS